MYKRQRIRRQKRRRKQRGGFGGFVKTSDLPIFGSLTRKFRKYNEFRKQKGFLNKAKYLYKNIKLIKYV